VVARIGRRYLPWATLGCIRETIFEGELKIIGCYARCKSLPTVYAPISQLAEENDLKSFQSGFEFQ